MNLLLLDAIEAELRAGGICMLATITERFGSAPRGTGTGMCVTFSGEQTGTLGGGSLEYRARMDATAFLAAGTSTIKVYEIHTEGEMASSGSVRVLFRVFSGESGSALCQAIREAFQSEQERYLVCELTENSLFASRVLSKAELSHSCAIAAAPEQAICTDGDTRWLIEPLVLQARVIVFGGGHVAQCMVRQLELLDYRIWVVEDRAEFARAALFPAAERVLLSDYALLGETLRLTSRDHAIVMSRGHDTDEQILSWLLRAQADYIGCIGSKRKIALLKENLTKHGVTNEQLNRLHAPIGLSIGAQTPAEIAVSVAAELILYTAHER